MTPFSFSRGISDSRRQGFADSLGLLLGHIDELGESHVLPVLHAGQQHRN